MIKFIRIKSKDYVSAIEFHKLLDLSDKNYSRNIRKWFFEDDYLFQGEMVIINPRENIDYFLHSTLFPNNHKRSSLMRSAENVNVRQEYYLSKELSKLIAINSKSHIKKKYVQWLLEQEAKIESLEYLTIEQVQN